MPPAYFSSEMQQNARLGYKIPQFAITTLPAILFSPPQNLLIRLFNPFFSLVCPLISVSGSESPEALVRILYARTVFSVLMLLPDAIVRESKFADVRETTEAVWYCETSRGPASNLDL